MNSVQDVWNAVYQRLCDAYNPTAASTWFTGVRPVSMTSTTFTLEVPSSFQKEILLNRFSDTILAILTEVIGFPVELQIQSEEEQEEEEPEPEPTPEVDPPEPTLTHSDYTFENFIVGSSNKLAEAACRAVANHTEDSFNPLFIYGASGLGKTHLILAIRNSVLRRDPSMKVLYLKGDEFTNEMVEAISMGVSARRAFREKYRYLDMLLIDDIQFIGGKESTQEEFFHTFNTLYEGRRQIVLTSDRPPKEIKTLEERLRTRFEWGLITDVKPPDLETRIAIINRKAENLGLAIPPEVADYMAQRIKNNIRQLEGAVKKLKALYSLDKMPLDQNTASIAIRDVLSENVTVPVLIDRVLKEVAGYYTVTVEDLTGKKRTSQVAQARQVAIYIIHEMTGISFQRIGEVFGGKHHTTIMYSCTKTQEEMEASENLKRDIEEIMMAVRSGG
ncbi:MAG: chromosomal replication initiator protein DnaA [Clostridia bacterium]|nr:chromosomal replication initiator protein DnaA [Clostridia bacterium]